jgi:HAD superfamily hydrolase (TIGR01549 family)
MKAVLFDLEGTLVESAYQRSRELVARLRRETKERLIVLGVPDPVLEGLVRSHALRNAAYSWADSNLDSEEATEIRVRMEEFTLEFDMFSARESRLYPDTIDALERLRENGCAMALVTNTSTPAANHVMGRLGLERFFDAVVTRSDVTRLKPDPAMVRQAEERMGLEAGWFVGDSSFDAGAAAGAGLSAIIIRRDGVRPAFDHDYFVESLLEVPPILGLSPVQPNR